MSIRPQRFILSIKDEGNTWGPRIVVRRAEAARVREAATCGDRILAGAVREIFKRCAPRWPELPDSQAFYDFVDVLNLLRVTQALSTGQTHAAGTRATGIDQVAVRDAINLLAAAESKFNPAPGIYSEADVFALKVVFKAAQAAKGIIDPPGAKDREDSSVWHDAARLIAWHVRRVLAEAGQVETAPGGRLSGVVAELLRLTEAHRPADAEAVRKVLAGASAPADGPPAGTMPASKMHPAYEIL